ncbi:MAG TPA: tetratricopeptide repeat protein [Blastocatellia bacterium]|nr:tetratricopeptide repeat protein [Blastocatellia bacterium]
MSKYAFLRSNASLIIIGLLLGLVGGFKIANSQYRGEQGAALKREIEQATRNPGPQAEVSAIIDKAKENPNDVEAQIEAAAQFIQIERPQDAVPFFEQARQVNPNDPRANAGLGVAYFMMGQFDKAIEALKRSREQGADSPVVSTFLIGSYIQTRKNLDEAERLLKELETQKFDPAKLARIRADLNAARTGGMVNQGATPSEKNGEAQKPKTTLSHGPEEPKISK